MENEIFSYQTYPECKVENALSVLSLFTFFNRIRPADFSFKGESHDFSEAVCVLSGKSGVTADKNTFLLSAGEIILHPPGEFHAIWSDSGIESELLIFSFRSEGIPMPSGRVFKIPPEQIVELRAILRRAQKAFVFDDVFVKEVADKRLASIVLKRLEIFLLKAIAFEEESDSRYTGRSAENYMRILSVMEQNLERQLTATDLAALCNMSVPAMEKTVFKYLGCGVVAYFNALKMQRAKEMLSEGASVKETAFKLGFSNQNYFSARFKQSVGVPPTKWRKN